MLILTCGPYHPSYEKLGGVPAISEIKFSLVSNRGCFGGCSFCALTFHQGRIIQTRSHESIVEEGEASHPGAGFQGLYPRCGRAYGGFSGSGPARNRRRRASALTGSACFPSPARTFGPITRII
ncbi:MAG: hypothetical protein ACLR2E_05610 [Lachnospiraceae bacterium]